MALLIDYEGHEYILDVEEMDDAEGRAMERFGIPNLKAFEDGIGEGDISALQVAFWLMLKQSGEAGQRLERVSFKPAKFLKALGKAAKAEVEAAGDDESEGKDAA